MRARRKILCTIASASTRFPSTDPIEASIIAGVIDWIGSSASVSGINERRSDRYALTVEGLRIRVTVAELTTGEVLSRHLIDPSKSYWRNQNREPGRWPSPQT